ncbi:MAG TPA: hypothetical protein VNL70_04600 [Tepidisphaeraceae bacterium]|nr:hypothetical protein [Tepidisphaeraceae bacterium]
MDLSRLPRLSQTARHATGQQTASSDATHSPPVQQPEAAMPPEYQLIKPRADSTGPQAWISIAIGMIIQLMSTRFWSFVSSAIFGTPFTWRFTDASGASLSYLRTVFFPGDLSMVLFGMVLILEGIVFLWARSRVLLQAAFGLTCATTLLNLWFVVWMMYKGYGLQLFSALAVAFGGYIAMQQWRMLVELCAYQDAGRTRPAQ